MPAYADCTPSADGETIYCQGEAIAIYGNTYTNMQVTNVPSTSTGQFYLEWVGNSPDGNGVRGDDANGVTLTFDGTGSTISGTQYVYIPAAVVFANSSGGNGSSGNHDTNAGDAKSWDGGDGGAAGDAAVVFSGGTIIITDDSGPNDYFEALSLITALSSGGDGGPSNDAHSVVGGTARGGEGGFAGNSNAAAITIDSGELTLHGKPFSSTTYTLVSATSMGGAGGGGGHATANDGDAHGGEGGDGNDAGGDGASVIIKEGTFTVDGSGGLITGTAIYVTSAGGKGGDGGGAHTGTPKAFGGASGKGGDGGTASASLGSAQITAKTVQPV